ncbi:sensor histidine kinase [Paenibacillus sp. Marseille-P2973]|nr:sensor histidine kinase [Paenibacillus sp. Marseille-P2973]
MRTYWIWFGILCLIWICGLLHGSPDHSVSPTRILGSALFFTAYFILPLLRSRPILLTINLIAGSWLAIIVLWPEMNGIFNPYTLLILSMLAGNAVYTLPSIHASVLGMTQILGVFIPGILGYPSLPPMYIALYAVLHILAFILFRTLWQRTESTEARNEALLSEYRKLKRRIAADEESARREERAQVGRDIHDSVGHKLTALVMQLEVFRMRNDMEPEVQNHIQKLKQLAQESLQETRSAVKTLQADEPGGLPAIMRLIRKLEADSMIKIHFTVKHGAFNAPLSNNQSIAVYRAVQEALTNIMKHSRSREAEVIFEAPGGSVFRFEIGNPGVPDAKFREGFGLTSMRERIEKCNGRLEVIANRDRFIVRGTLPLNGIQIHTVDGETS